MNAAASAERVCTHPSCGAPLGPVGGHRLYCAGHSGAEWDKWRFSYRRSRGLIFGAGEPAQPRPESEIRADLAALLAVQIRRFHRMVAHDRATDPLR